MTTAARRAPDRRRVVVTGVGMITPLGGSTRETFERASQGSSGIDYIRRFDTRGLPVQIGGEVADQWIRRPSEASAVRLAKMASRAIQLVWVAAMEAAELQNRQITVNAVTAGLLKTDSLIVLRQYWPAVARLPASAFVELEDVAGVVLFLCTDAARGIRGQHIVVDNGLSNEMLLGAPAG